MVKIAKTKTKHSCGLCGKSGKLTKTPCCGQWICNDSDKYAMFSYARNSCFRNHDRYTLCSSHHHERHGGNWKDCKKCRKMIDEIEMYVWYGTNKYNFEKLENPPAFEPTKCRECCNIINLGEESHAVSKEGYFCEKCMKQG